MTRISLNQWFILCHLCCVSRITTLLGVSRKRVANMVDTLTMDKKFGRYNFSVEKMRAGKMSVHVIMGKELRVRPTEHELALVYGHRRQDNDAEASTAAGSGDACQALSSNSRAVCSSGNSSSGSGSSSSGSGRELVDEAAGRCAPTDKVSQQEGFDTTGAAGTAAGTAGIRNMLIFYEGKRRMRLLQYVDEVCARPSKSRVAIL
jgi:hypothetical protein